MRRNLNILTSGLFLTSLVVLIVNDFFLKYMYPGFVTGKLSDFAGLIAFSLFFSAFFIDYRKVVHIATGLIFIYWKSQFSQPLIDIFHDLNLIYINRTVDYWDLLALTSLPVSYTYLSKPKTSKFRYRKILLYPISVISMVAFTATTLPREYVESNVLIGEKFYVEIDTTDFYKFVKPDDFLNIKEQYANDSVFYCRFYIPQNASTVESIVTIQSKLDTIVIQLDSIKSYTITGGLFRGVKPKHKQRMIALPPAEYLKIFETRCLNYFFNEENKGYGHFCFINKEYADMQDGINVRN